MLGAEELLTDRVFSTLQKDGFEVALEVPFYSGSVDLVAIRDGRVVAIEVKVKAYRRAIVQATKHLLFAHEVYVALPLSLALRLQWDTLAPTGIGLLGIDDGGVTMAFPSVPRSGPDAWQTGRVVEFVEKQRSGT